MDADVADLPVAAGLGDGPPAAALAGNMQEGLQEHLQGQQAPQQQVTGHLPTAYGAGNKTSFVAELLTVQDELVKPAAGKIVAGNADAVAEAAAGAAPAAHLGAAAAAVHDTSQQAADVAAAQVSECAGVFDEAVKGAADGDADAVAAVEPARPAAAAHHDAAALVAAPDADCAAATADGQQTTSSAAEAEVAAAKAEVGIPSISTAAGTAVASSEAEAAWRGQGAAPPSALEVAAQKMQLCLQAAAAADAAADAACAEAACAQAHALGAEAADVLQPEAGELVIPDSEEEEW
jgi:hypothetical protein